APVARGGGETRGARGGRALWTKYGRPWARQQENYCLSIPREQAGAMSARVQALLGYSIHPPFMGHANGMHPQRVLEPERVRVRRSGDLPQAARCVPSLAKGKHPARPGDATMSGGPLQSLDLPGSSDSIHHTAHANLQVHGPARPRLAEVVHAGKARQGLVSRQEHVDVPELDFEIPGIGKV